VYTQVQLAHAGCPKEIQVKVRLPKSTVLQKATINGLATGFGGQHGDTIVTATENEKNFDIRVQFQ
jgi:hypothetical protein